MVKTYKKSKLGSGAVRVVCVARKVSRIEKQNFSSGRLQEQKPQ
jgi:hypothetical protein